MGKEDLATDELKLAKMVLIVCGEVGSELSESGTGKSDEAGVIKMAV